MSVDIEARVRQANPVSRDEQIDQLYGADTSRRLLSDIRDLKEGRMTETRKNQEEQTTPLAGKPGRLAAAPRRLTPGIALAAFLIVIAVGIAVVVAFRASEPDVVSPQTLAAGYIEAVDAYDAEAAVALFARDAVIDGDATLDEMHGFLAWLQAAEWRYTVDECSHTSNGPVAEVTCSYTHHNAWTEALDVEPVTGTYEFTIDDGRIVAITNSFNVDDFDPVWSAMESWILRNGFDRHVMYADVDRSTANLSPESIALWRQATKEFVESIASGGGS